MSARGRARKVRDGSAATSPPAPRKELHGEDKRSADADASCPSKLKLKESQQVRPRKAPRDATSPEEQHAAKSGERKGAPRGSARKDNSMEEEKPSTELQSAPGKAKKSQRSQADKTAWAKVSYPPKLQETQEGLLKKPPDDAISNQKTPAAKAARSREKKTPTPSCSRRGSSVDENPSKVLQNALDRLKLKKTHRSESAKCVNSIQNTITEYIKRHLDWCKDISILKTGSYYENVKICEPDEFDVMMTVRVERVKLVPFSEDGAFYSVEMKRHSRHPLDRFVNTENTLSASKMLSEFREKVKEVLPNLPNVTLERKKMGCPAVTLLVNDKGKQISIDLVLGLEVHSSWPSFTQDGFNIETWLGKKVRTDQRRKPFYLVPKYEGRGNAEQDGIMAKDAWRISFSHVEKYILKNHGNSKTCCEGGQKCCRKQCLKLMKYLLKRLKEEHPEEGDKLCSYHAKTTLLHACAAREEDRDWADSELSYCFEQLLRDFEQNLRTCQLHNFFIPSQNLFKDISKKKCNLLADYIDYQRNNGFPLLC